MFAKVRPEGIRADYKDEFAHCEPDTDILHLPPDYAKLLGDTNKTESGHCLAFQLNGNKTDVEIKYGTAKGVYKNGDLLLGLLSTPSSRWFQEQMTQKIYSCRKDFAHDDRRKKALQYITSSGRDLVLAHKKNVFLPEYWEIRSTKDVRVLKTVRYKKIPQNTSTFRDQLYDIVSTATLSPLDLSVATHSDIMIQLEKSIKKSLCADACLDETDIVTGSKEWHNLCLDAFPDNRQKYDDFVNEVGKYASTPKPDHIFAKDRVFQIKGSEQSIWFQNFDGRGRANEPALFSKYYRLTRLRLDQRASNKKKAQRETSSPTNQRMLQRPEENRDEALLLKSIISDRKRKDRNATAVTPSQEGAQLSAISDFESNEDDRKPPAIEKVTQDALKQSNTDVPMTEVVGNTLDGGEIEMSQWYNPNEDLLEYLRFLDEDGESLNMDNRASNKRMRASDERGRLQKDMDHDSSIFLFRDTDSSSDLRMSESSSSQETHLSGTHSISPMYMDDDSASSGKFSNPQTPSWKRWIQRQDEEKRIMLKGELSRIQKETDAQAREQVLLDEQLAQLNRHWEALSGRRQVTNFEKLQILEALRKLELS